MIISLKNQFLVFLGVAVLHRFYCNLKYVYNFFFQNSITPFENNLDPDLLASDETRCLCTGRGIFIHIMNIENKKTLRD